MNTVVEQRFALQQERGCLLPNPGMTATPGGCERHPQHDEESVFLTPISSPALSSDGNAYTAEISYFGSGQPSPSSSIIHMEAHPLQSLPPHTSAATGFMAPGSPCEELCGSPYSPPYDNPSPHSMSCSTPPHGSPTPGLACSDQYATPPYISPSPSLHDIPASSSSSTLPITSAMSLPPYSSIEEARLVYSNVHPTTYFSGSPPPPPPPPHWITSSPTMTEYDAFTQTDATRMLEGEIPVEIPVTIIDQMQQQHHQHQQQLEAGSMEPKLCYYPDGSPTGSPEGPHHATMFYSDMTVIHAEVTASATVCSPYSNNKQQTKTTHKIKKVKPVVQVNDEHIKDIPTSAQLWEFTLRVLKKPAYHYMVNWENRKEGLFRFHDAPAFAALWGKHRNRPNMTYDKVARALRYYYKRDILNQVGGRLTYRFSKRLGKLYATDD